MMSDALQIRTVIRALLWARHNDALLALRAIANLADCEYPSAWEILAVATLLDDHPSLVALAALVMLDNPTDAQRRRLHELAHDALRTMSSNALGHLVMALNRHAGRLLPWAARYGDEHVGAAFAQLSILPAIECIQRLGAEGWAAAPPTVRDALLIAATHYATPDIARCAEAWGGMNANERILLARSVAALSSAASEFMALIGAEGWAAAPPEARAALSDSIKRDPLSAARGGAAVWSALADDERRAIIDVISSDVCSAAALMERIGAVGWSMTPEDARESLLQSVIVSPSFAALSVGAVWMRMTDKERRITVQAVSANPQDTCALIKAVGAAGWRVAPDDAKDALLASVAKHPPVAQVGGDIWMEIAADDRLAITRAVAPHPDYAALLIEGFGAEGWRVAPIEARTALLSAIIRHSTSACASGKVWQALTDDERLMIAHAAAVSAHSAAALMGAFGAEGWLSASDDARAALLGAVANHPYAAANGGGKVWQSLADDERLMIARTVIADQSAVAILIKHIGAHGWSNAPESARTILLEAALRVPNLAYRCSVHLWDALTASERQAIVLSIASHAANAADLLLHLLDSPFDDLEPELRSILVRAACRSPQHAQRIALKRWDALTDNERARAVQSAARAPEDLSNLLSALGADAWETLPPRTRAATINGLCNKPRAAAHGGSAIWMRLTDNDRALIIDSAAREPMSAATLMKNIGGIGWDVTPQTAREALIRAVAQAPEAAVKTLLALFDRLNASQRDMLAVIALRCKETSQEAAQALRNGADWRDWMTIVLPDETSDDETIDAWREALQCAPPESAAHILRRLPASIAVRVIPRSPRRAAAC